MRTAWVKANRAYAETMGSAFPSFPFNGIVHSVFSQALNLQDTSDGILYTLLTVRESLYPRGIVVRPIHVESLDFCSLGLQSGQAVTIDSTGITFDCGLWVSFLGAKRTHARQESPPEHMTVDIDLVLTGCSYLSFLQEAAQTELKWLSLVSCNTSDSLFVQLFHQSAHQLQTSFSAHQLKEAVAAGKALLGFGPGLTPTGDDFLCGFALAAYSRSSLNANSPDYITKHFVHSWFANMLDTASLSIPPTNVIALNFLHLAAAEKFSYSLIQLATAFEMDRTKRNHQIRYALDLLSLQGHSSGLDAATGFFFGIFKGIPSTA